MCCGSYYCPDKNFYKSYDELKPEVQRLLTIKLLGDSKKKKLYQLIGCGESINYLTFDNETYSKYIKEIETELQQKKIW